MAKLYPPKLDNILPAFAATSYQSVTLSDNSYKKDTYYYKNDNNEYILDSSENMVSDRDYYETAVVIKIPYELNSSVGDGDFSKISYIVKSATTNKQILSKIVNKDVDGEYLIKTKDAARLFELGQYYKIQIAFVNSSDEIGYYSNVGIARYINIPTASVEHSNLREVVGTFSDNTTYEKVYNYSFNLYNDQGTLIETSGIKLHNASKDNESTAFKSHDYWELQTTLESEVEYYIEYSVTTTGNYSIKTDRVLLTYVEGASPRVDSALFAENNFEEGYNRIYLDRFVPKTSAERNRKISGNFYLLRASHKDNYSSWEKLIDFQIWNWEYDTNNSQWDIYKDYFIEQGVSYKYAIQAYNSRGVYSAKLVTSNEPVYSDFEDIFLYDGDRQLKIRFNPKVGTVKNTLLESKIDTIGGRFPTFFRNGNVNYKEFSLSGLISLLGDKNNEFMTIEEAPYSISEHSRSDIDLSAYNYQQEREFKLEVLSWLTNGKEKILKTAAEGNYIVRLMNVSLTPNDTLGRLIHTFQATAYEVAEFNAINLKKMGFLDKSNKIKRVYKKENLTSADYKTIAIQATIDKAIIYTEPNTIVEYKFKDDTTKVSAANVFGILDLTDLLDNKKLTAIRAIEIEEKKNESGQVIEINHNPIAWAPHSYIEFSYLNKIDDTSSWYYYISCELGDGEQTNINGKGIGTYLKDELNTDETNIISSFPYIKISKRRVDHEIEGSSGNYVYVGNGEEVTFVSGEFYQIKDTNDYIFGSKPDEIYSKNSSIFYVVYDGQQLNTNEGELIILRNVSDFACGAGLTVDVKYVKKILEITSRAQGDDYYAI